jgi:hypothetical protein
VAAAQAVLRGSEEYELAKNVIETARRMSRDTLRTGTAVDDSGWMKKGEALAHLLGGNTNAGRCPPTLRLNR